MTRKAHKLWDYGRRCANPLNILVHLQVLCAPCGKELGFSWYAESSKQSKDHSRLHTQRLSIQSFAPSATVWLQFQWRQFELPFEGLGLTEGG